MSPPLYPGHNPGMKTPPIRVLIVDDDPRVRAAVGHTIALELDLVLVADAADAAAALALAGSTRPSVALVDVLIPDEAAGLALVGSLSRLRSCAVVAMSMRGGLRDAVLAAGAVAFVEKSGEIDAIVNAVRAAAAPHALARSASHHSTSDAFRAQRWARPPDGVRHCAEATGSPDASEVRSPSRCARAARSPN